MKRTLPHCIGVIHLPALAGAPGASLYSAFEATHRAATLAVKEAKLLERHGFDGIILENFGDAPFFSSSVPHETIAALATIAARVKTEVRVPIGINVLRNDSVAALAIAAVTGASFIRVNVLSGVMATDQGLIEGRAAQVLRDRERLSAGAVAVLADVHVKHAKSLSSDSLSQSIEETAGRGGADAVIVTGTTTGRAPTVQSLTEAARASHASRVPLYVGSGLNPEMLAGLGDMRLRAIVGSTLRESGKAGAPLEPRRMKAFMKAFQPFLKR